MNGDLKIVRTRMAPSPTGEYHIGHIRTLLYNWAFARGHKGKFILRIEDTDRKRYVAGATEKILKVIKDYGFDWDEGPIVGGPHEPYVSSGRLDIYKKHAEELVAKGKAYYCFCTPERLDKIREDQRKKGVASPKYDKHCLNLSKKEIEAGLASGRDRVIRLDIKKNTEVSYSDLILGKIRFNTKDIDDTVLLKSDGFPTYHLAVVVDDHLMEISHILRGSDWVSSTPKHVLLYQAFGWTMPMIGHLPNIKELGQQKKLSKRFGPVSAREFWDKGYLPEAVVNFLMLLGWNPGSGRELFTLSEFVKKFSLDKIHKTDLVSFDRVKLDWMNGQYIQKLTDGEFAKRAKKFAPPDADDEFLIQIAPLVKSRIKTLSELNDLINFFFKKPVVKKKALGESGEEHLKSACQTIENLKNWSLDALGDNLMREIKKKNFHTGKFFMDLRIAITGNKITPPINESIILLGKKESLARLDKLITNH